MEGASKKIVLVGHCGPDSYALKHAVSRMAPGSSVVLTMSESELTRELPTADLVLVNRLLDGDYALSQGVDLIAQIASSPDPKPATMLISNYADAQAEAETAGARPGFGKRDIYTPDATAKVRAALGL